MSDLEQQQQRPEGKQDTKEKEKESWRKWFWRRAHENACEICPRLLAFVVMFNAAVYFDWSSAPWTFFSYGLA